MNQIGDHMREGRGSEEWLLELAVELCRIGYDAHAFHMAPKRTGDTKYRAYLGVAGALAARAWKRAGLDALTEVLDQRDDFYVKSVTFSHARFGECMFDIYGSYVVDAVVAHPKTTKPFASWRLSATPFSRRRATRDPQMPASTPTSGMARSRRPDGPTIRAALSSAPTAPTRPGPP
ncbi:hypothetical protein GCM10025867_49570 (plasmid) [Frondihabitans sucicola]|uniref:Uncharacterized protein n=1 Tax=Frondihabitans sucicola TaxID=1268041 RepID=A0ABN6Y6R5_9MICO|nr:hypothetical protein GCM10025867_49570 [Frondihabitans sucicola]